jgi:RNA polymerase sigma-70 factor (ECF subfamily)
VPNSDVLLVARVVADGDHSSFELLVRRYQSGLRNFLRRLTKNDYGRADDLAQETFFKAYRSIHTYKGTAAFSSWLYRIAYNSFLNDERGRFPETEFDESQQLPVTHKNEHAIKPDIDRALESLSLRRQAVFDLHYKKGMTHFEISETLELPLGTVKSDLRRGLEKLKQYLKD